MEDINNIYFNLLKQNLGTQKEPISLFCQKTCPTGNAIAYSLATDDMLSDFNVVHYENIKKEDYELDRPISLNLIKMQAGLGSSVRREDIVQKFAGRKSLGAKGTDLFLSVDGEQKSISELQLLQAISLEEVDSFKHISYTNLVNDETQQVVSEDWGKSFSKLQTYEEKFHSSPKISKSKDIFQKKMPTIGEDGELTTDRMAPAGHGFVGVHILKNIFNKKSTKNITVIGNGEDLNSTPELPLIKWISKNNIPVVMITTTKTKSDLKGGQISLLKSDEKRFLTIVEKAQAQESGQLEYFEDLGLRDGDRKALFNTNIVVINESALAKKFEQLDGLSEGKFLSSIAPDVISNIKEQNGKKYTQLESALGSVMLNLDRYFRDKYNDKIVSIVNVNTLERENFFIPIKKREDYDDLVQDYVVSRENYRVCRK